MGFLTEENKKFALEDLAKSGLEPKDIGAEWPDMMRLAEGALAGYVIPYYGLDGIRLQIMSRTRMKFPEFSKSQRYIQPTAEQLAKYNLPSFLPYIHPLTLELEGDTLVCCEGEKKTASVIKYLGMPAFGIGGCQMWRDPGGRGGVHPWIRSLAESRGIKKFLIVPDGDLFRYDICNAYGTFAHVLRSEGYEVKILNPPGKIDDLLVAWGGDSQAGFGSIPQVSLDELVQSPVSLSKRFNLAFKQDDKGRVTVHQHTANVMKLLEEHDAFPRIWRDLDVNRVMVGEKIAEPGLTEMDIANYFQYNLGFDKVNHRVIASCIEAMARRNSKSPMLEYIRNLTWDGNPRLETWMERHWGVPADDYTREVASKFLIGACARMDKPGTKLDWMLIVVGPQAVGKTSMPSILFRGLSRILYGEQNHKDLHLIFHSSLCVIFDELDSFGKRESSNLKAMVTTNEDAFRPPYGASVEIFPRRFTLYGCGNRHEFLQYDPSGYRRYAVIEVARLLDFRGLESELDQLWAEAWLRYTTEPGKFWEITQANEKAESHITPNPVEDMIIAVLDSWKESKLTTNIKDGRLYFTMAQLMQALEMGREVRNPSITREISAILRKYKAEQGNSTKPPVPGVPRGRHYWVEI